jgi:hypothetical protein
LILPESWNPQIDIIAIPNLSISQKGEVFAKFNEANEKIGYPLSKYEEFITEQEVKEDARDN